MRQINAIHTPTTPPPPPPPPPPTQQQRWWWQQQNNDDDDNNNTTTKRYQLKFSFFSNNSSCSLQQFYHSSFLHLMAETVRALCCEVKTCWHFTGSCCLHHFPQYHSCNSHHRVSLLIIKNSTINFTERMCSVNCTKLHRNKAQILEFVAFGKTNEKKLLYTISVFIRQKLTLYTVCYCRITFIM